MLTVKDEMLFYNQSRFVPERRLRGKILSRDHGLHVGMTKMKARIAETFWWPNWTREVEGFVRRCGECEMAEWIQKLMIPMLKPVGLQRTPLGPNCNGYKGTPERRTF